MKKQFKKLITNLSSKRSTHDNPLENGYTEEETIDRYSNDFPTDQNAVDIFSGDWASVFPPETGISSSGYAGLFNDPRIDWMVETIGGINGKSVLDLGPLEAGHAYSLELKHHAEKVLAIEANERAYLKCLVAKEVLGMKKSKFLLGDFNQYMEKTEDRFEVTVASGVLYHMDNPAEHIKLLCTTSDTIFVWTHYYDKELIDQIGDDVAKKFNKISQKTYEGYEHTLYQQDYLEAIGWGGFCGAGKAFANWLSREDIYGLFEKYGFEITDTSFEENLHIHGPSFAFVAKKKQTTT